MLERNVFGSTLSLGALLNENLFSDGEADQFLQELGVQNSRGLVEPVSGEAHSGADSFESTFSGLGTSEDFISAAPGTSEAFPSLFPSLNSSSQHPLVESHISPTQQPIHQFPGSAQTQDTQQGLAILGQLFAVLSGSNAFPPAQPLQESLKQPQPQNLPKFATALKTNAPPAEQYTTVPQRCGPGPVSTEKAEADLRLPNLNAQQQQALQTIMNLGQLGTTKEGKKVRRMLSNRESARRSRHRKQAHVMEIEEKAARLEAENNSMKVALSRAAEQEMRALEERTRMCAEISALRIKVQQLEQSSQSKTSRAANANLHKRGISQNSTQAKRPCTELPACGNFQGD